MIPRYTSPEMGRIWSDQRKYETWLQVELAAVDAMARAGIVPTDAARDIRARATFSIDRIEEIEQVTQHDVIAFTTAVAEHAGPAARWLHFGLTSSDVLDTAQALQMRQACDLIVKDLAEALDAVQSQLAGHGRLLVRYSGTEPLLRIMLEGREEAEIRTLANEIAGVVRKHLG